MSTKFNDTEVKRIQWQNRDIWFIDHIAAALGYSGYNSLQQSILHDWARSCRVNQHYVWAEGEDARQISSLLALKDVGRKRLLLLTEEGVNLVCLKTTKPAGDDLKDWLASEVMPKIRRDGAYVGQIPDPVLPPPPTAQPDMVTMMQTMGTTIAAAVTQSLMAALPMLMGRNTSPAEQPAIKTPEALPAKGVSEQRKRLSKIVEAATTRSMEDPHDGSFQYAIKEKYNFLHGEFFRRTNVDLDRLKNQLKAKHCVDVAERNGHLPRLLALAIELFGDVA